MVKHVILWQLKDELSNSEKADVKAGIKAGDIVYKVDGEEVSGQGYQPGSFKDEGRGGHKRL